MLAATLTDRVATASVKSAKTTTSGLSNWPTSATGSQIALPNTTTVADVISTATSGKRVIVVGSPRIWPTACAPLLLLNCVKSGRFNDSLNETANIFLSDRRTNVSQ